MTPGKLIHEPLTRSIIGAFFEVYRVLGFGFLEHVYVASLTRELHSRGHEVAREVSVPVFFKGEEVARQRLDLIVDSKVVIEVKSTESLHAAADPLHRPPLPRKPLDIDAVSTAGYGQKP